MSPIASRLFARFNSVASSSASIRLAGGGDSRVTRSTATTCVLTAV
jgi:hypothetical protein